MCKPIGELIGSYLGNFLEYDEDNNWGPWRKYMRIKVALDVNVPLKKDWAIRKDGGDWVKVMFKYERLGIFCFLCGIIGHTENCLKESLKMTMLKVLEVGETSLRLNQDGTAVPPSTDG
jgi:hypothetical protein